MRAETRAVECCAGTKLQNKREAQCGVISKRWFVKEEDLKGLVAEEGSAKHLSLHHSPCHSRYWRKSFFLHENVSCCMRLINITRHAPEKCIGKFMRKEWRKRCLENYFDGAEFANLSNSIWWLQRK